MISSPLLVGPTPSVLGLLALTALFACSQPIAIGERDGGLIVADPRADYDECANGMDDDGDGLIDESCPCSAGQVQACFSGSYPHRLIGACRDGAQDCQTLSASEFGSWGTCEGDTVPGQETCDGLIDDNCDGAIDEGCACEIGDLRPCAQDFSTGPCSPGSQRCREDGVWSGCLGAVGPGPELCSDLLDNDCDGLVNEGCECIAEPEVCGDGVDNDCDMLVDEPGCRPEAESCTLVSAGSVAVRGSVFAPGQRLHQQNGLFAWQPAGQPLGLVAQLSAVFDAYVDLWRADGMLVNRVQLDSSGENATEISLSVDGEGFIVMIQLSSGPEEVNSEVIRLGAGGQILARRRFSAARGVGALRIGDVISIVTMQGARMLLERFDLSLTMSQGAPLDLGSEAERFWMQAMGEDVAIAKGARFGGLPTLTFVRGSEVVARVPSTDLDNTSRFRFIDESGATFLFCGSGPYPENGALCQRLRRDNFSLIEPAFNVPSFFAARTARGLVFASSTFPGRPTRYSLHRVDDAGEFDSQAVVYSANTFISALYPTRDGRLLLVLNQSMRTPGIFFHDVGCGTAWPSTDCPAARELACQDIATCCEGATECILIGGNYPLDEPNPCPLPSDFCVEPRGECMRDLLEGASYCRWPTSPERKITLPISCLWRDTE